jgi:putative acetyltransferase
MFHIKNESAFPEAIVRAVEPEDYPMLKAIYEQPDVLSNTLQLPFPSVQLWKDRISNQRPGTHMLIACVDDVGVGHIGLTVDANARRRHAGYLGMGVHDDFAGRGIGELLLRSSLNMADAWLNLTRLELTVFADNERAIRLYERTGFEVEGRLRNYAFRNGSYVDALSMARLR